MVTLDTYGNKPNIALCSFSCLSTDVKPTVSYNGTAIANGSTLHEIDTNKNYVYNQESAQWVLSTSGGGGSSETYDVKIENGLLVITRT